jgi:transcriptional antiterminator NusG
MREIMARIGKEQAKPKVEIHLKLGDTVKVKSGPFEGQVGPVVDIVPAKGIVKFMVSVFGRETVVETEYLLLEKI